MPTPAWITNAAKNYTFPGVDPNTTAVYGATQAVEPLGGTKPTDIQQATGAQQPAPITGGLSTSWAAPVQDWTTKISTALPAGYKPVNTGDWHTSVSSAGGGSSVGGFTGKYSGTYTPSAYGFEGQTGQENMRGPATMGLQVEMWQHLSAAFAAMQAAGVGTPGITDGFRSYAAQVDVKRRKGSLASTPGNSVHGLGYAADLDLTGAQEAWLKRNGGSYGLINLPSESWHWQLAPQYATTIRSWTGGGGQQYTQQASGGYSQSGSTGTNWVTTNYHPGIGSSSMEGGFGVAMPGGKIVRDDSAPLGYYVMGRDGRHDFAIAVPQSMRSKLGSTITIGGIPFLVADVYGGGAHGNSADILALPDRFNTLQSWWKNNGYYAGGNGSNGYSSGQPVIRG